MTQKGRFPLPIPIKPKKFPDFDSTSICFVYSSSPKNGIPCADTILRVLGRIDRRKFQECFLSWTRGYFRERVSPGSVIAVDGKTVKGSESGERKA
jgi:hypothetical protein